MYMSQFMKRSMTMSEDQLIQLIYKTIRQWADEEAEENDLSEYECEERYSEMLDDIEPIELVTQVQASLECQQQEVVLPNVEPAANLEMGDSSVVIDDAIPKIELRWVD